MKRAVVSAIVLALSLVTVSAFAKDKPVMAVIEFNNHSGAYWWSGGVGDDLADMLTNELAATDKFKMVERSKLSAVLQEQDLAASGAVSKGTGAKIGKLTGAKYLITGSVASYEENTKGTGGGLSFRGISVGGKKDDAYLAIDLRIINSTTGVVEHVRTVEARSGGYALGVGFYKGGLGGNLGKYDKTPAGKAIRACLIEATDYLTCVMVDKDGCEEEYAAKEKARRDKTKGSVKLD
ncbi:MAG: CsgG/HfaB family protein [Thermoanaerobaculia bacterium]|jgi:curli biogenesis system outer membrane secretion channel CsgG